MTETSSDACSTPSNMDDRVVEPNDDGSKRLRDLAPTARVALGNGCANHNNQFHHVTPSGQLVCNHGPAEPRIDHAAVFVEKGFGDLVQCDLCRRTFGGQHEGGIPDARPCPLGCGEEIDVLARHLPECDHRDRTLVPDGGEVVGNPASVPTLGGLTGFQRDCLAAIGDCNSKPGPSSGQQIKQWLESSPLYEQVNHSRLYPNLDTLVEEQLVEKGTYDRRTHTYQLTDAGRDALSNRAKLLREVSR